MGNESQKYIDSKNKNTLTLDETKIKSEKLKLNPVTAGLRGRRFMPKLPMPAPEPSSTERISYDKDVEDIETVKEYLLGEQEVSPSRVGEECFDQMLREAQQ